MASTTFTLSADEVLSAEKRDQIHKALSLIAVAHGLELNIEVVEPKLTYKIEQDSDPTSPRENDNVGVMYCRHRRYTLGDEGADDPMVQYEFVDLGGYKLYLDDGPENAVFYNDVLDLLDEACAAVEGDIEAEEGVVDCNHPDWVRAHEACDWVACTPVQTETVLRDDIAVCLPLYLYDHGGITISHGRFSCPWDSGQVGWHYVTKEKVQHEFDGDLEKAERCMELELKEYDEYLQGNVWWFTIEDEDGGIVDSCSGFIGSELEETGMLRHVVPEHRAGIEAAWERRFG